MTPATLADIAFIERHGYQVKPLDCGTGPVAGNWVLTHDDGTGPANCMIGEQGGVSSTKWECVAEAQHRIAADGDLDYLPRD